MKYKFGLISLIICVVSVIYIFWTPSLCGSEGVEVKNPNISNFINTEKTYKQVFSSENDIYGIEVCLGTYGREVSGNYIVEVYDYDTNQVLERQIIYGNKMEDNEYYQIIFEEPLNAQQNYYFTIFSEVYTGEPVIVWMGEHSNEDELDLYLNEQLLEDNFDVKMVNKNTIGRIIIASGIVLIFLLSNIWNYKLSEEKKEKILHFITGDVVTKKQIVASMMIFVVFGVFCIIKMNFYANNVGGFPDEVQHVSYIAYLQGEEIIVPYFENMQSLAGYSEESISKTYFEDGTINYLGHPPLYYNIMRLSGGISFDDDGGVEIDILRIRYFSQIIAVIGLAVVFYIGFKWVKSLVLQLIYVASIVSVPMFTYVMAGINNDTLAFLMVSIFLLGLLRFHCEKKDLTSFLLIAVGVTGSLLTKLTAGAVVVIGTLIYLLYVVYIEKSLKSVFCKKFLITTPIYLFALFYYVWLYLRYSAFSISLSILDYEYFKTTRFYNDPSNRVVMGFFEFLEWYLELFVRTWGSWISHFALFKDKVVFSWETIGLTILLVSVLVVLLIRKTSNREITVIKCMNISVIITFVIAIRTSYNALIVNGYQGGCHARYLFCAIPCFGFSMVYIFEYLAKRICKFIKSTWGSFIICMLSLFFVSLLLYEDFIWFITNY